MKYLIILCDECNNERSIERVDQALKSTITDVNTFHGDRFLFDNSSFVFQVVAKNPQDLVMTLVTKESGRIRRARSADASVRDLISILLEKKKPVDGALLDFKYYHCNVLFR